MTEQSSGAVELGEAYMTTRQMVAEIRKDVKDLVAWKNRLIGAATLATSTAFIALIAAVLK